MVDMWGRVVGLQAIPAKVRACTPVVLGGDGIQEVLCRSPAGRTSLP